MQQTHSAKYLTKYKYAYQEYWYDISIFVNQDI